MRHHTKKTITITRNMKPLNLIPLLALTLAPATLYAQAPIAPAPVPTQQAVVTLPMPDEQLYGLLRNILQADVEALSQASVANTETAQEDAREAVDAYMEATQQAYEAQLAFAEYSLSAIATTNPQQYTETLGIYRRKLQLSYLKELALMRGNAEQWIAPERRPRVTNLEDAFTKAVHDRANVTAPNMIALRQFHNHPQELLLQQIEFKRQYLLKHLTTDFDFLPPDREFLSGSQLPDFASEDYINGRIEAFNKAEQCWDSYAERAAALICPVRALQGAHGNTTLAIEQLLLSHEAWLTELAAPMR